MTIQVATSPVPGWIVIPGGLAVSPSQEGHRCGIEVDQVELLAAMCIVTGIAGNPTVFHVLPVFTKVREIILPSHISLIIVTFEAEFLAVYNKIATAEIDSRIICAAIQDVQTG